MKTVIIVGGGFAGLNAAKALIDKKNISVILVDQRNHHLFQPLLYQVATAGLNPSDIAAPIRAQFSDAGNVEVHWGKVNGISLSENKIHGSDGQFPYDYLILACGAQHSYFDHPEWEQFAPGLKTLEQATEIRRRILSAFERAENELDPAKQKALLNFVIVGGGPTGVELAGAIADISRTVLVHDFKRIDPSSANVILIEGGPRVLSSFSENISKRAEKDLEALGVSVYTNTRVEKIDESGVTAGSLFIPSQSVLWAAGVQASRLEFSPALPLERSGKVAVEKDLSVPGWKNVFVVGDMAHVIDPVSQTPVPGLAPAAIQEGIHAAEVIIADIQGHERAEFKYNDKGQMATIGKSRAVLQVGSLKLSGTMAWFAWLFIHIFYLIGFKNRISVMFQWTWSYLFSKRGARLITDPNWKLK